MKRIVFLVLLAVGFYGAYAQAPQFDAAKEATRAAALLQKVQDSGFALTDAEKESIGKIFVDQKAANAKCRETIAAEDVDGRKACAKEASKARNAQIVTLLGEERAKQFELAVKAVTPKRPAAPKPEAAPAPAPAPTNE